MADVFYLFVQNVVSPTLSLSLSFISPACLFRYNALSLVYLLYLLLLPWFTWPNKHTAQGKNNENPYTSHTLSDMKRNEGCIPNLAIKRTWVGFDVF